MQLRLVLHCFLVLSPIVMARALDEGWQSPSLYTVEINDTAVTGSTASSLLGRSLQDAVVVEVYYAPHCGHCLDFIRLAVIPLIEAKLPGDLVKLTVLPLPFNVLSEDECGSSPGCYGDLAPLCAMKATQPHPTPVDSPYLLPAIKFLVCDLAERVAAAQPRPTIVKDCAAQAGLPWGPLESCARGPEVFSIMFGADYNSAALATVGRLTATGFKRDLPYPMPLILLNGEVLECSGGGCTGTRTAAGTTPLLKPGSLLSLVCALLNPQPAICSSLLPPAQPVKTVPTPPCENCMEVGKFQWRPVHKVEQGPQWSLGVIGVVLCVIVLARYTWACRRSTLDGCRPYLHAVSGNVEC